MSGQQPLGVSWAALNDNLWVFVACLDGNHFVSQVWMTIIWCLGHLWMAFVGCLWHVCTTNIGCPGSD